MLKKRYLFLIMLVFLFAVSAVSAEEMSNETNMLANNHDSSLTAGSISEDILSVYLSEEEIQGSADNGTFTALQKKIDDAPEGSTINLDTYNSEFSNNGITINKTLAVGSNGYVIDAPDVTVDYDVPEDLEITLTRDGFPVDNAVVNININGYDYTETTDYKGKAYLYLNLNAGSYDAVVSYRDVSTTVHITVNQLTTKTTLSYDSYMYDWVSFTALVNSSTASGNVVFNVNGKDYAVEISDGEARYDLTDFAPGSYTVKATYEGDINHKTSTSNIVIIENDVQISAPEVVKYYGGPERFVVTLTDSNGNPVPNQQISITINGPTYSRTTDENGMASLGLNLISGEYDVVVNYEDINVTSKVTVLSTINGNDLVKMYNNDTHYHATFLDLSGNYLSKDTSVILNLNGIFYSEKIIDNKGTAKLDINEQPGEYILTAVNPVTGEHAVNTIIVLSNIVENHDLIKYYNESTKFSVRVLSSAGNPASGEKVKFSIRDNVYEATSNSNGYAFLDAVLQAGKYVVTTSYNGLDVNNTIMILPTLADKDMEVSSSDIYEGENEVIKVVLPKDATGKVRTTINGKEYSANVNNGASNIIVPGLNYGNYVIEVIYSGDSHYNSVKNKTSFRVDKAVDLSAPDVTKYYGGPERFIVTLNDLNGKPISNAQIKITINGRTSDKTTDDNGIASMGINLNSGEYITTTEYDGIKVNSTVTVKDTVIAKDFTKIFKNGTQYQGTFVDSKGNLIKSTDVKININGVFYTRATNSNGVAQMNINLPPGTYILTATNPLSGEQHTTKVTVLPNIVENYDLTKYYKNASQYSLRLLDDKGNPVGAGVSIQLNINGIFYTKTSDANGYVKMNINLPPGTYIITAEYKGLRASNTIKVLSVLETKDLNMKFRDGSKFEAKVLDGQGNPYAGQTVTFNINGVFYTKTTDADGIARLNINLPAGTYIITSMYNGLNAANNVKIASDSNDEIFYIDLPFQDDIDMIFQKGKYKVNVCQWRIPIRCALNIILYDLNDNIISKFDYYSYYFYEGAWHEITVNDMGGNYHKWSFPPDAHITKVAVKLKDASWY